MAWDETTSFKYEKFRSLVTFRVFGNLGCALMWKPWFFVAGIGAEKFHRRFAVFIGPFAAGFGPINEEEPRP